MNFDVDLFDGVRHLNEIGFLKSRGSVIYWPLFLEGSQKDNELIKYLYTVDINFYFVQAARVLLQRPVEL